MAPAIFPIHLFLAKGRYLLFTTHPVITGEELVIFLKDLSKIKVNVMAMIMVAKIATE